MNIFRNSISILRTKKLINNNKMTKQKKSMTWMKISMISKNKKRMKIKRKTNKKMIII